MAHVLTIKRTNTTRTKRHTVALQPHNRLIDDIKDTRDFAERDLKFLAEKLWADKPKGTSLQYQLNIELEGIAEFPLQVEGSSVAAIYNSLPATSAKEDSRASHETETSEA